MLIERALAAKFSAGSTFAYLTVLELHFFFCLNLKGNITEKQRNSLFQVPEEGLIVTTKTPLYYGEHFYSD